jgi:hypothetical protein
VPWQLSYPLRVTDVNNLCAWSAGGNNADGTLYTGFLAMLNTDRSSDGFNTTCLANHCDWRIPNIAELKTIISVTAAASGSSPCVDPAFGPTKSNFYWSATTFTADPNAVWTVRFPSGAVLWFPSPTRCQYVQCVAAGDRSFAPLLHSRPRRVRLVRAAIRCVGMR